MRAPGELSMLPNFNNVSPPPTPSREEVQEFCNAARDGDITKVTQLLDQYGPTIVNERDGIDARAITWAAFSGNKEIVQLLLDRGADINAHGTSGKPALTWAVECGHLETTAFLLDRGASLEERDDTGMTPLDYARRASNTAVSDLVDQWIEDKQRGIVKAAQREEQQKVDAARAAAAERLRKLKENAPGHFKITPNPKHKPSGGPKR
jgi:hypothetical protein